MLFKKVLQNQRYNIELNTHNSQFNCQFIEAKASHEDFIMMNENPVYAEVSKQSRKIDVCDNNAYGVIK